MNLLVRGIGNKIMDMQQGYSHHHLAHAHHTGLIIGTIAGSCAVTVAVAIAIITLSPKTIFHPLSFTSHIGTQSEADQTPQPGAAASQTGQIFSGERTPAGIADQKLSSSLGH